MKTYDVRVKSYRSKRDYEARQLPVFNLVRVDALDTGEALRKAAYLEGYYINWPEYAMEVKPVR